MPDIVSQSAGTRTDGLAEGREALRKALRAPRHLLVVCAFLLVVAEVGLVAFVLVSNLAGTLQVMALCAALIVLTTGVLVAWDFVQTRAIRVVLRKLLSTPELGLSPEALAGRRPQASESPGPGALPRIKVGERFFDDPFDIPASGSERVEPDQYEAVFGIIEAKYGRLLEEGFRNPEVRALLLCGRQVVGRARTPEQFDLDEIRRIEEERNRLCFIYGKEDLIEECGWSSLDGDDAYPTLRVWLSAETAHEPEARNRGVEIVVDFDTGNPRHSDGFYAFEDALRGELALGQGTPGQGRHMGGTYKYTRLRVRVGTIDESGGSRSHVAEARFVWDWRSAYNPFLWANPQRRGFVGREIMFALGLRITLDPSSRQTRVDFV